MAEESIGMPVSSTDFLQFLDISPDALIVINKGGTMIAVNQSVEKLFGYKRAELLGMPLDTLLPVRYRDAHHVHRVHYFENPRPRPMGVGLQLYGLRKDNTEFPVDISLRPLLLDGIVHAIGAVRDMSKQHWAEQELQETHQQLDFLQEQQARYDTFLSMASHELRTPITTLLTIGQMFQRNIERPPLTDPDERAKAIEIAKSALDEMVKQILRMNRLIGDLLDVSRTSTGHLSLILSDFLLDELVSEVVATTQSMATTHTITVEGATCVTIHADRDRIEQVLVNLLNNAIKYSPQTQTIEVLLSTIGESALISVRDHGIGIAKEHQAHLFERYYRLIDDKHKKYAGLGIGLYIAAQIVERHKGKMWVDSEASKGATFTFSLPLSLRERMSP